VGGSYGQVLTTLKGDAFETYCVAWSPDGKMLASAGRDTVVKVWDAATGQGEVHPERARGRRESVAWSPDGKVLATASSDRTVRLWDVATGKEKARSPWTELAITTTEHRGEYDPWPGARTARRWPRRAATRP